MNLPAWLERADEAMQQRWQRLPHAILIRGPGGWGESLLAERLGRRLLGIEGDKPLAEVAHPDLRWIQPEDNVIKVDVIRGVCQFLVQTQSGERKLAIIDRADRMNVNAANALLKSLEEPPPDSYIFLVSGASERLLPTVRSRCQVVTVAPADEDEVRAWLAEQGVDEETMRHGMAEYGGAPLHVLDAHQRGQAPLWPLLRAVRTNAELPPAADLAKEESLADCTMRLGRLVHRLVRSGTVRQADGLRFYDELMELHKAALVNTGLNRQLQLERLLLRWRQVAPERGGRGAGQG